MSENVLENWVPIQPKKKNSVILSSLAMQLFFKLNLNIGCDAKLKQQQPCF